MVGRPGLVAGEDIVEPHNGERLGRQPAQSCAPVKHGFGAEAVVAQDTAQQGAEAMSTT